MENADQQSSLDVGRYWALVRHRRWWLIAAVFVGWATVVGASWFLPAKYRSETVILVEQQKVPERYVESNVAIDLQQRLHNITQEILSRTRLFAIAKDYHLYAKSGKTDPDALVALMRKDITIELGKPSENQLTSFKVSYSAHTPELAQQVTGALTSLFIEDNLRNRQQLSEDTTAFLQTQLQTAREDLAQQEQRLREFKTHNLGELPEQLQGNLQILAGLQSRLQGSNEALNQAEQQKLYLNSLLSQYKSLRASDGDSSSAPSLPALEQQLEKMHNQLNDLSARYTPQHPDIARLKQQIVATERFKARIEQEIKSGKPAETSVPMVNPAEVQIEGQVKANELNIANRKREIKDLEVQIREYESRLNLTPVREQQLAAVTRDYQQSRANYESLLAKKQQSEMATNLEKRQQGEQFRVLDPPSFPLKPYFPNRFNMSLAGIGVGVGLAFGLVILLEIANARVYREEDLRDLTSGPVLVGIPSISTPREEQIRARQHWMEAVAASFLLACVPIVTLLAYLRG